MQCLKASNRFLADFLMLFLSMLFILSASDLRAGEWKPSATVYNISVPETGNSAFLSANSIIGEKQEHEVIPGETLLDIAREYHLGYEELIEANPGVDPWIPAAGLKIKIPSVWILPNGPRRGLVLNIPEMRLYFYLSESKVMTFPVGIGMEGWEIPPGNYSISDKKVDPVWNVPPSIQQETKSTVKTVPAGPDNPLGRYWMRLSMTSFGIHGTNNPWAVGRRVTHGCIRLYPEDIAFLFPRIPPKTPVTIVYQYAKIGIRNGKAYFQINRFNDKLRDDNLFPQIILRLHALGLRVDVRELWHLLQEAPNGPIIPVPTGLPLVAVNSAPLSQSTRPQSP
jgi:L,D-transpeptidase ErfK/SrfK